MAEIFKLGDGEWLTSRGGLVCTSKKTQDGSIEGVVMEAERSSPKYTQGKDGNLYESEVDEPAISYENNPKGSLLLEPSATNLLTYSERQDVWSLDDSGGSSTVKTANYGISPYGTKSSTRFQFPSGNSYSRIYVNYDNVNGKTYTFSVWLKSAAGSDQTIYFDLDSNLSNFVTVTSEWKRFEFTRTTSSSSSTKLAFIGVFGVGADVLVWGSQVEEGSFATSYIKTNTQTEVRDADSGFKTIDISKYLNQSEGVFEVKFFTPNIPVGDNVMINISNGFLNDVVGIRLNPSEGVVYSFKTDSNLYFVGNSTSINFGLTNTIKLKWKSGDFGAKLNGVELDSSNSAITNTSASELKFIDFTRADGNFAFYGEIDYIKIYDSVDDY